MGQCLDPGDRLPDTSRDSFRRADKQGSQSSDRLDLLPLSGDGLLVKVRLLHLRRYDPTHLLDHLDDSGPHGFDIRRDRRDEVFEEPIVPRMRCWSVKFRRLFRRGSGERSLAFGIPVPIGR
jgi:hypothetical protein